MTALTVTIQRRWEVHHPMVVSALVFVAVLWWGPGGFSYADRKSWHLDQLYTCIFTYSTVITAFLFTFYTFIITGDRGFLSAARESVYFRQTVSYTFRAILLGAVLSLATIPMLVIQPLPKAGGAWLIYSATWAAVAAWATAAFIRAAWLFAIFARKLS